MNDKRWIREKSIGSSNQHAQSTTQITLNISQDEKTMTRSMKKILGPQSMLSMKNAKQINSNISIPILKKIPDNKDD